MACLPIHTPESNVRFGSKADISAFNSNVRFTPNSGHSGRQSACPLCATSGHWCYSITSSARESNCGGTDRPSAFAVFRLMTSSIFVGRSMGRSPGLAPFKILSTKTAARR